MYESEEYQMSLRLHFAVKQWGQVKIEPKVADLGSVRNLIGLSSWVDL